MRINVVARLKELQRVAGSQKAAASALGVSAQYFGDLVTGRREPGPKVLKALGLERVSSYREAR